VSWRATRLEALCKIEIGKTPARASASFWDEKKETRNVWLSIADLGKAESKIVNDSKEYLTDKGAALCKRVTKGTLLLSFKLTLGRVAFAGTDLFTNEAIAALAVRDPTEISKNYLYYFLQFFDWDAACKGDVKLKGKTLNKEKLRAIEVRYPPLPEQRRIVSILDEAFAGLEAMRANAEKNLQNARELFNSISNSVFSGPSAWAEEVLDDVVSADCSLSYGIVQPGNDVEGGLPIVRPTDLVSRRIIEVDGLKRINPALAASYQRTTLQGGDLLLCVRGSTGTVAIAADDLGGANVTRGIVPIRFDPKKISPCFAYHLLRSADIQAQIRAKTYGAALMQINIKDLRNVRVQFPKVDEQTQLSERLDSAELASSRLVEIYAKKLAAIDELKQAILQKAFAGELTAVEAVAA
jgi:type I restriction enzyme S subunit